MTTAYRLVSFGVAMPTPTRDLAQLHAALLPSSPVSLLGRRFMERFYYRILPREGLICGAVAYVDAQPAGFVVATHDPDGFMRSAFRKWWPYLVWVVGISVLLAPQSLKVVWEAAQVMRSRQPRQGSTREGEILSLGVAPVYREPTFVRQTDLRLSHDLLESAVTQLRTRDVQVIRATVSAENMPAKLFYSGLGWTLDGASAPGWRHPTVQFIGHVETYPYSHVKLLGR